MTHMPSMSLLQRHLQMNAVSGEFRLFIYLRIRFSMGEKTGAYTETDTPDPLNAYARTKLEGENEILKIDKGLVLRTNIFGWTRHGLSFSEWVLDGLKNQKK